MSACDRGRGGVVAKTRPLKFGRLRIRPSVLTWMFAVVAMGASSMAFAQDYYIDQPGLNDLDNFDPLVGPYVAPVVHVGLNPEGNMVQGVSATHTGLGQFIDTLDLRADSLTSLYGGNVQQTVLQEESRLNLFSGSFLVAGVGALTSIQVFGGRHEVHTAGSLSVLGGEVNGYVRSLTMSGGIVSETQVQDGMLAGGTVDYVTLYGNVSFEGTRVGALTEEGGAVLSMRAGNLRHSRIEGNGELFMYGGGFSVAFGGFGEGLVTEGYGAFWTVTGRLADGTPVDGMRYFEWMPFGSSVPERPAHLHFVPTSVPEPSSLGALALAVAALVRGRRRRSRLS